MPHFKKLTPNLLVANVERSLAFYVDTLGFARGMTVPDASPFVFASVTSGAGRDLPQRRRDGGEGVSRPSPASRSAPPARCIIEVEGVDALHDRLKPNGEDRDADRDPVLRHARVRDRGSGRLRDYVR